MDISNKKIAFHIHTKYSSDCKSEPKLVVDFLFNKGIDVAIITDHNTIEGAVEAKTYAEAEYPGSFQVIIGEEVLTDIGDVIGFPVSDELPKGGKYQKVISEMRSQGAAICLPHPYKSHDLFLVNEAEFIKLFDFIEIYNSRLNEKLNLFALKLCDKFKKIPIVGIDAHTIEDLDNCFIRYNSSMQIIDSRKTPTPVKNIRRSQMINAERKKQKFDVIKYKMLSFLNQ